MLLGDLCDCSISVSDDRLMLTNTNAHACGLWVSCDLGGWVVPFCSLPGREEYMIFFFCFPLWRNSATRASRWHWDSDNASGTFQAVLVSWCDDDAVLPWRMIWW